MKPALRSRTQKRRAADAPRVATIYNGFYGRAQFVSFRKGDPEGNRWIDNDPLFVDWSRASVNWLSEAAEARWQGHKFFFTDGLTYNIHARGVLLKSKLLQNCIFDASASMLSPITKNVPPSYLLALLNSHVVSFYIKKFLNNTWHEISDLRRIPIVIPTPKTLKHFEELVRCAFEAKRLIFANATRRF